MNACIRCSGRRQGQYVQRFGHYCKRCFGVGAVSAQHSRLQVSASRPKSLGARGYFRPNKDKDMPKANNEPKPFRLRG